MPQIHRLADADPQRYYKYTSRATAQIILENKSLRWSSPLAFNDPFDNQFDLHIDFTDELRQMTLDKLWDAYINGAAFLPEHPVGKCMGELRKYLPLFSREEFDEQLGPGIDGGMAAVQDIMPQVHQDIRQMARQHKILCLAQRLRVH